ncbi:CPBP family intramembrane glutamic endopeptidase [Mesobacillus foraminis]|uniref:CPBP family intramembrane glutamic endopeptidase n=1 Tax=Mesobacillus foraminis TaxID=279826 RepID=UPI000EF4C911|nr:CPBP family intramembrane glutamic endopeptidase [Mesobacillus foraminis]
MQLKLNEVHSVKLTSMNYLYLILFIGITLALHLNSVSRTAAVFVVPVFILMARKLPASRDILTFFSLFTIGVFTALTIKEGLDSTWNHWLLSREYYIIATRLTLLVYIIPFLLYWRISKKAPRYLAKGSFTNTIYTPFIWKGIKDPIWRALLIAGSVNIVVFAFFIDLPSSSSGALKVLSISFLFAIVNASLEEVFWRGLLLSYFVDALGEKSGLILSSFGFGLYHLSMGLNIWFCAGFIVGGFLLGGLAIRAKGILPSFVLHFLINLLMVMAGAIFHF